MWVPWPESTSWAPSGITVAQFGMFDPRPVVDGGDPRAGDVGVGARLGAVAQAGVGHRHRLARPVVAAGVGRRGAADDPGPVLVVLLPEGEVLDPGHLGQLGEGSDLGGGARHQHQVARGRSRLQPGVVEALDDDVLVDAGMHQDPVQPLGSEVVGQLVLRLDGDHVGDRTEVGDLLDPVGLHPHEVGEVGGVAEHLGPGGGELVLGLLADRPVHLDDVVGAALLVDLGGGVVLRRAGARRGDHQTGEQCQHHHDARDRSPHRSPYSSTMRCRTSARDVTCRAVRRAIGRSPGQGTLVMVSQWKSAVSVPMPPLQASRPVPPSMSSLPIPPLSVSLWALPRMASPPPPP